MTSLLQQLGPKDISYITHDILEPRFQSCRPTILGVIPKPLYPVDAVSVGSVRNRKGAIITPARLSDTNLTTSVLLAKVEKNKSYTVGTISVFSLLGFVSCPFVALFTGVASVAVFGGIMGGLGAVFLV